MTHIGPSITFDGVLTCTESLRLDGQVRGDIVMRDAELTIGQSAKVDADIRGVRVLILGTVNGNVTASERIELGASASVTGGLTANRVVIVDGARFTGRVDMDRRTIAAKIAHYKETQVVGAR
jgi:cytoskeletal protein CcmA (bactofilin family)